MNNLVVISGCSGGGKTTLLEELANRGHQVVEEPGRRIVAKELRRQGHALPWIDLAAFARRAIALALVDRWGCDPAGSWIFFDRGLVDAAVALQHATGELVLSRFCRVHRYHHQVFLAPPWPDIYRQDDERRHSFADATAEYERLHAAYVGLGYDVIVLPKIEVQARARFIMRTLTGGQPA